MISTGPASGFGSMTICGAAGVSALAKDPGEWSTPIPEPTE